MKFWDKVFMAEDKTKKWIENHRMKWMFVLVILAICIGFFGNYLLGGDFRQGAIMSSIYAPILLLVELTMGREGYGI